MYKLKKIYLLNSKTSWHIPAAAIVAIALVSMKIKAHKCVKIVEGNK